MHPKTKGDRNLVSKLSRKARAYKRGPESFQHQTVRNARHMYEVKLARVVEQLLMVEA